MHKWHLGARPWEQQLSRREIDLWLWFDRYVTGPFSWYAVERQMCPWQHRLPRLAEHHENRKETSKCSASNLLYGTSHPPLEAGDALGMHDSTLAHSCSLTSTKLPREPKTAFQTHISFQSSSTAGSQQTVPCSRTAGLGGSRGQHRCRHRQQRCGQLATNHIRRR